MTALVELTPFGLGRRSGWGTCAGPASAAAGAAEPGAPEVPRRTLSGIRAGENAGNARFARTSFDEAPNRQPLQVTCNGSVASLGRTQLSTLTADDPAEAAGSLLLGGPAPKLPSGSRWVS